MQFHKLLNEGPAMASKIASPQPLRLSLLQPELMQPAILGISLTYIMCTVFMGLKLLPYMAAVSLFTYYCCILSVVSVLLFYVKRSLPDSYQRPANWLYILLLMLIFALFIGYCFVRIPSKFIPGSLVCLLQS